MKTTRRPPNYVLDAILDTGGSGHDKLGLVAARPYDCVVGVLPKEYRGSLHVRMALLRHMFEIVKLERTLYLAHERRHGDSIKCGTADCRALKRRLDEIDQEIYRHDDMLGRQDESLYKILKKLYGAEPGMVFQFRQGFKVVKVDEDDEDPSISYMLMWSSR